jgi:hypothetical protein
MKQFDANTKAISILWKFVVCTVISLLYSCGSGGSGNGSSETGSVRFSLTLLQDQGLGPASNIRAAADAASSFECQTDIYTISTIEAKIVDGNNQILADGGPWDCEDHQGTISDVPAGGGRIVKISAKNYPGVTIFWGKSESVIIKPGQQTDAGKIYLEPVNQAPVLKSIGNQQINEGNLLQFNISATDPNDDVLIFEIGNKPPDAVLIIEDAEKGATTGKFSWTPSYDSAGNYQLIFKVSDNGLPAFSASEQITISVGNVPQPPVLSPIGSQRVKEGELLKFDIYATDPDSTHLRFEVGNKPTDADFTFEDFGDGTGTATFSWMPDFSASGDYSIIFKVFDDNPAQDGGPLNDFEEVTIEVGNICRAPKLYTIVPPVGKEGELLEFTVTANDADLPDDLLTFSCISKDINCEEYFNPSTYRFSWVPGFESAGNYQVRFIVTDACADPGPLQDFEDVNISVGNICRPPVLEPIGSQTINAGLELKFTISATDPDLPYDTLSYSCVSEDIACEEFFDPSTRIFSLTPGMKDVGNYQVRFIATDACPNPEPLNDFEDVTITVQCPDLVVESISNPIRVNCYEESYCWVIQASIKNIGNQSAGPSLAGIGRSGRYNGVVIVDELEPRASSSVTFQLESDPGDRWEVTADYKNDISECNEENNSLEFQEQEYPQVKIKVSE